MRRSMLRTAVSLPDRPARPAVRPRAGRVPARQRGCRASGGTPPRWSARRSTCRASCGVRGIDVVSSRGEGLVEGGGDVRRRRARPARPPPPTGAGSPRPRPAPRRGSASEAVVGQGQARPGRRAANRRSEVTAWSRSKSGGGVDGRSTPASGSRTPTASPAKRMPLAESCRARWCLAWPGESTVVRTRSGGDADAPRRRPARGCARPAWDRAVRRASRAAGRRRAPPSR